MAQKKVYSPCRIIKNWAIVNYEKGNMFNIDVAKRMTQDLISEAQNMGTALMSVSRIRGDLTAVFRHLIRKQTAIYPEPQWQ